MVVKLLTIDIHLPGRSSLKEKRLVMSSLKKKLTNKLNVSVAEVDYHDKWQRALLAVVTVGNDRGIVESTCDKVVKLVEDDHRVAVLECNQEIR
jgi:uncharacterized protein YlxP (DUF503 family)